jgi:capsular exopolysaccharide synthesis family protein
MAEHKEITIKNQDFFVEEAIKTLRTNIGFCGENINVISITSTFPHEGKSEISTRLAASFAEAGSKTILLDADNRSSVLAGRLGLTKSTKGLSHILSGKEKDFNQAITKTDIENFDIIFAGPPAPNPTELLNGPNFEKLIRFLRTRYDYVIIDCPPLGLVIDAAIIAKECEAAIMVIAQNEIKKKDAKKMMDQLTLSGARILGTVLNKVKSSAQSYGHYGKYGYGYGKRFADK